MNRRLLTVLIMLTAAVIACSVLPDIGATEEATDEPTEEVTNTPAPTSTPLPAPPVEVGEANPNEPVFISGTIPFTSRFIIGNIAEPFVLLEDQAGFVARDEEFTFPLVGQAIGPVELIDDQTLSFSLSLPSIPQGTQVDVDNDGESDAGVQVFAVAFWSNTWGGPFLEERDGHGWSGAYVSTELEPGSEGEIIGGHFIIWAPDDEQEFPTGFGDDGMLFTEDDPVGSVPAGYSIVDLNEEPFNIYKESEPVFELIEGPLEVHDYSEMSYVDAFNALYEKISRDYPFTEDKGIDWEVLYDTYAPQIEAANTPEEFYVAILGFTNEIPDGHIGGLFNPNIFFTAHGGDLGLILAELSDGTVIVTDVLPGLPADEAGIQRGAEIIEWDGLPVGDAISAADPNPLGPHSTDHNRRGSQLLFLTLIELGTRVDVTFVNPGGTEQTEQLSGGESPDNATLIEVLFPDDEILNLPVEGYIIPGTNIGYISIHSFADDDNLTARLFERYMDQMIENEVSGLILDMRRNGGGFSGLASAFAGFFYDEANLRSRAVLTTLRHQASLSIVPIPE